MLQKGIHKHKIQTAKLNLSQKEADNHKEAAPEASIIPIEGYPPSLFILEAKTAPNRWQNIQVIYPRYDLPSCYLNKDEALSAKAALKSLLLGKWRNIVKKHPIRVRRIDRFLSEYQPNGDFMMCTSTKESNILSQLRLAVIDMDERKTLSWLNQALAHGLDSHSIIQDGFCKGMEIVGRKCEAGEYFFPQLIDFSKILDKAMKSLKSGITSHSSVKKDAIIMGVIQGDIHDIGKNIIKSILTSYGHDVLDLGKDVPPLAFIESAVKENAGIICVSASLKTTMAGINEILNAIGTQGLQDKIKVIVGGNAITEKYAKEIGAHGYAPNAAMALTTVNALTKNSQSISIH